MIWILFFFLQTSDPPTQMEVAKWFFNGARDKYIRDWRLQLKRIPNSESYEVLKTRNFTSTIYQLQYRDTITLVQGEHLQFNIK